jgi:hypothetical protein
MTYVLSWQGHPLTGQSPEVTAVTRHLTVWLRPADQCTTETAVAAAAVGACCSVYLRSAVVQCAHCSLAHVCDVVHTAAATATRHLTVWLLPAADWCCDMTPQHS